MSTDKLIFVLYMVGSVCFFVGSLLSYLRLR